MERLDLAPPHPESPLALPPAPPEPPRAGFPVLATLAPVVGALGLWGLTGSPFSLVFAAIGPVVAVASLFDARRQARRQRRLATRDRERRLEELHSEIVGRHALERNTAWRRSPSARQIVDGRFAPEWRDGALPAIVLGRGEVSSRLRIDGAPLDAADRAVLAHAARLDDGPVLADAEGGIGFVGALPLARAAARAVIVQGANRAVPGGLTVESPTGPAWEWAARLPHRENGVVGNVLRVVERGPDSAPAVRASTAEPGGDPRRGAASLVAVAEHASTLPPGLATVVTLEGPAAALVRRAGGIPEQPFTPDLVGDAEAREWVEEAAQAAARAGLAGAVALPARVPLRALEQPASVPGSRSTLAVAVGAVAGGGLEIDLVRDGPHALVAGTTGSGKSEFLLAWLTALALAYSPERVSFLLVDFKGGAAFASIRELPQVTGIVTDLDEGEAERAVASLRAELRHREQLLFDSGARDITELDAAVPLARLVIVVDEFQAMIERFPDLGSVIADIAARGRSLGVHLVLASQRPNGVVREQVTANCAIRVSLRVVQRADSIAVVGTPAAAEIRPDSPGRGIVDRGDGCPVPFQSAIVDAAGVAAVLALHARAPRARRPWLDPLPTRITAAELASSVSTTPPPGAAATPPGFAPHEGPSDWSPEPSPHGVYAFGLVDEPELQRRSVARWSPSADGHLLVVGMPGSGRSTSLAALAHAAASQRGQESIVVVDGRRSAVWDAINDVLDRVRRGTAVPCLLVVDDLDTRFRAWPDDYRHAILDSMEAIMREGRTCGIAVVASVAQLHGLGQGMRDAFAERVLLRHPTRSDLVQAGGAGELWRGRDAPGSAQWRGRRVQVVDSAPWPASRHEDTPSLEFTVGRLHAVASATPRADAEAITALGHPTLVLAPGGETAARVALASAAAHGEPPPVLVGDTDAWASSWGLVASIREDAVVVVHGGAAEYRSLMRDRALPPLLDDGVRQCWVTPPGEGTFRAGWPVGRRS